MKRKKWGVKGLGLKLKCAWDMQDFLLRFLLQRNDLDVGLRESLLRAQNDQIPSMLLHVYQKYKEQATLAS